MYAKTGYAVYDKLTGRDEEWATEPLFQKDIYQLNLLLESKLLLNDPYIPIEEMLPADRDLMLIHHRLATYGPELSGVVLDCSRCGFKLNTTDLSISKVNYEPLELDPIEPHTNVFLWTSPEDEYRVRFRLPNVQDAKVFEGILERAAYVGLVDWVSTIILSVNDVADTQMILEAFELMPPLYYRALRQYVEHYEPYVIIETTSLMCMRCGQDNTITAPVGFNLLQLNERVVREIAIKEFHFINKNLNTSFNELVDMPIENRRRLLKRNSDYIEEVEEHRRSNQQKK